MQSSMELDRGRSVATEVAGRLAEGFTPTAAWYTDPALHELEKAAIFGRTWQLVGTTTDVAHAGDYFVTAVDEYRNFIVVRGGDGALRAFANSCPHRGSELLDGRGCAERIRCPYHAWTFDLDGKLRGVPGLKDMGQVDLGGYGLREASVDTWGPFVFLNAEREAPPLADHLAALPEVVGQYGIDLLAVAEERNALRYEGTLNCNWKIAVENALECYHCPTVHPGFKATVDLPRWQIALKGSCIVQGTTLRQDLSDQSDSGRMSDLVASSAYADDGSDLAMFHWLFPNYSISLWPGPSKSFNYARWVPLGPDRCKWETIRWWSADVPDQLRNAQWDFIAEVGEEDHVIVERVHRGMKSGLWGGGQFMLGQDLSEEAAFTIRDERGPHRFNAITADTLVSFCS